MQDVQNIPNSDVNSNETNDGFGSHSGDVERPEEDIPVPPDSQPNVPIEEPPTTADRAPIEEDNTEPKRIA
jgi:hypothetical protein